ncbi:hypothetical protein FGG08_003897 [Glutinoglossum americanum]|uniref:Uncharacterized protein n=1 Tax=Glutinoglossum americanum TaxID=1670608 RepID=A0A9P8IA89_9PEZI|nr:hypothetical protein FGG08_003897 [Glutinoglossum americanum]
MFRSFLAPLLSLALLVNAQTSGVIDCSQWDTDPATSAPLPCTEYVSHDVSGSILTVYHFTDDWHPDRAGATITGLDRIGDAAWEALTTYVSFVSKPLNIKLVLVAFLVEEPTGGDTAASTSQASDLDTCYVRVPQSTATDSNIELVKQTVAHELYHCVEFKNTVGFTKAELNGETASGWWIEGAADYFSNVVYPYSNTEWDVNIDYIPSVPLYINDPYGCNMFFQFLASNLDDPSINKWIAEQPLEEDIYVERSRLSQDSLIQTQFPQFAQRFAEALIKDTDGSYIPVRPMDKNTLDTTLAEGESKDLPLTAPPFSIIVYTAAIPSGQTIDVSFDTTDPQTDLYFRKAGDAMTPFAPFTALQTISTSCEPSSGAVETYEFLFVSTADQDYAAGTLHLTRTPAPECPEDTGAGSCADTGLPIDPCIFGHWSLDISTLQTTIERGLAAQGVTSISNLVIDGTGTFAVDTPDACSFVYDQTHISMDVDAGDLTVHTDTLFNGDVQGSYVQTKDGEFCLKDGQGTGEAVISSSVFSTPITWPLGEFAVPTMRMQYTCTETSLEIRGMEGSVQHWIYAYARTM